MVACALPALCNEAAYSDCSCFHIRVILATTASFLGNGSSLLQMRLQEYIVTSDNMISSTYIIGPLYRPWLQIGIVAICILIATSLGRTLWFSYQTQRAISQQEAQVRALENKVELLEAELQTATSSFTLEKRLRDELKYQKPDEQILRVE